MNRVGTGYVRTMKINSDLLRMRPTIASAEMSVSTIPETSNSAAAATIDVSWVPLINSVR